MSQQARLAPTCAFPEVGRRTWDVLVVGAGPSGSIAARQLAMGGASVLLVDKAEFPRRKVCGCYLNGSALATLNAVGLGSVPSRLAAPDITGIRMGTRGRVAELSLPTGAALSREALDTALAEAAIDAGSDYLCRTTVKVGAATNNGRTYQLQSAGDVVANTARCIVVADGVGGQSVKDCDDIQFSVAPKSLVGTAAITSSIPSGYASGTIHMAVGRAGYVGSLQLENGDIDIAAALDPAVLKHSSPAKLAQEIADQSGLPHYRNLAEIRWLGTPPLSRTPTRPAAEKLLLVGDAAGYVEPFTGEGISWALASGRAVAPLVLRGLESGLDGTAPTWIREHRRLFRSRQRLCRWLTRGLRSPWLAAAAVAALGRVPSLAIPVVRRLNRAPGLEMP